MASAAEDRAANLLERPDTYLLVHRDTLANLLALAASQRAELEAARAVVEAAERHVEARERFLAFNGNAAGWRAQELSDAVDRTAERLREAIDAAKAGKAGE
jgi:hypothetical protein